MMKMSCIAWKGKPCAALNYVMIETVLKQVKVWEDSKNYFPLTGWSYVWYLLDIPKNPPIKISL